MLSGKAVFQEIFDNDEAFALFCSIAASGEAQGGWENRRIATLVPEKHRDLAPKIARHGTDEDKHGRIFVALLRKRGLNAVPVPPETDYTMLLERRGIGLAHEKLRRDDHLDEGDILTYLVHSRVTEQRAAEQMQALDRYAAGHDEIARAVHVISRDEDNHLAYCQEELLRLGSAGRSRTTRHLLRETARAEIEVHHDVSRAVMARMGRILRWPAWKSTLLGVSIDLLYGYDRVLGWRRLVRVRMPGRRNALGVTAQRT